MQDPRYKHEYLDRHTKMAILSKCLLNTYLFGKVTTVNNENCSEIQNSKWIISRVYSNMCIRHLLGFAFETRDLATSPFESTTTDW